ncbi:MAG: hypothetical protein E7599_02270 [Ruminococcaceae bacterium]|nr:hypothetical protein [Oscillospiraceae bacterium]
MYRNEWKNAEPRGCSVCGKIIQEGDEYIENNETVVCTDCAEELDLCDVLEFLESESVLALFRRIPDCVKTVV